MALFGAPYSGPDDAIKAVRTAVAMQKRMEALKGQFGSGKNGWSRSRHWYRHQYRAL